MELVKELHHRLSEPLLGRQNALEVTTVAASIAHSQKYIRVVRALVIVNGFQPNDRIIPGHHYEGGHPNVGNLVVTGSSIIVIIPVNVAKHFGSNFVIPVDQVVHSLISFLDIQPLSHEVVIMHAVNVNREFRFQVLAEDYIENAKQH